VSAIDPVHHLQELAATATLAADKLGDQIRQATELARETVHAGGTLFFAGNGGSAADAQHMATEYVVRYMRKRRALRAIALTTDTSLLTAAGNDFGFEEIFSRQLEALGRAGDRGKIRAMADLCLVVPTERTDRAQEIHLNIQHAICDVIDAEVAG